MRRNRWYFLNSVFLMLVTLCSCSPQLTIDNHTHEANEELLVEVVDTAAPEGTFEKFFIATNKTVGLSDFGISASDDSKFTVGFRNPKLIMNEEELAEIFHKEMSGKEKINVEEVLGISWEPGKDNWEEKEVSEESLESKFTAKKDGLYRIELAAVDEHGNATVMNCYALIDTTAPVISGVEDKKITLTSEADLENITTDGVIAEDNMLGNITSVISVQDETIEQKDDSFTAKVTYTIADICGNKTIVERILEFETEKKPQTVQMETLPDGFNKAMAQEAFALVNQQRSAAGLHELAWDEEMYDFACTRAVEIVSKFSHERPDGTWVTDSLHAMGYTSGNGENAARYSINASTVVRDWMNSEAHKENILRDYFYYGAIGCYLYNGRYYWVNLFRG